MKTLYQEQAKVAHAAFLDALSGEFIARTGYGAYVHLNPFDVHRLFKDYLKHGVSIRDYVKQSVKAYLSA
ncbi:MAG: hypothetical protein M0R33_18595 [Methylomonas sp.]|jgi:hypothetical protein|uniref:hypothetical protein n=1 Tax=Methylomonas sp. TaxID=418 RepID=UPI0025F06D28|nr:hypothetical protein [Methylomonas sp.]MCK9608453.1 hypothetical protein [Methylomonas sp.]